MWDWDGFFIGLHWANQDPANAKYLRDWVLGFAGSADADGYVAGCITPKGPRPLFGKFAMKPFLAQGAVIAAEDLHDYEWIRPVWPAMKRVLDYRRRTQYDEKWKLWFWDNAMQSGADNNAALTNDPKDPQRDPRRRRLCLRHARIPRDGRDRRSSWRYRLGAQPIAPKPSPLATPSCASSGLRTTPCSGTAAATLAPSSASSRGPTSFRLSMACFRATKAAA